jgi:cell division protein FtsB
MSRLSFYLWREWPILMLATLLAVLVLNGLWSPSGVRDLLALRHHRNLLIARRNRLIAENTRLREHIVRLHSDDAYLQRIIRQELGYVRPGEVVYRFPPAARP